MVLSRTALVLALVATLPAAADTQKKPPVSAQAEAAQKKADIKRFLALSDRVQLEVQGRRQEVQDLKKGSSREIPEAYWADLAKAITPELVEPVLTDVYDKSYTASELREVLQVVDTPAFRKYTQIEQTTVQKAVGAALNKYMEEAPDSEKKALAAVQGLNAQKKADIKRYLELTEGVSKQVDGARRAIQAQRRQGGKDMPESVWTALLKAANREAFEAVMMEVYDKSYTAQEMKGILKIIDNPLFKRFSQNERTSVQKAIDAALDRTMTETSRRLMQKHQAAKGAGKGDAPKADAKKG
jgi:hypothetical protein